MLQSNPNIIPTYTSYLPIVRKRPAIPDPPTPPTIVTSSADAQITQGRATMNFGTARAMWAGYDMWEEPYDRTSRSLIRFSLSAIPSGSTIINASLRLYQNGSYDFGGYTRQITTYRVTQAWSETSVTWDTAPGHAEAYGSAVTGHGSDAFGWYSFPVTSLVQAWIDGTYANHGVMLRGPEHEANWRQFSTREGANPPRLEISYVGPTGVLVTVILEAAPGVADSSGGAEPDIGDLLRCQDAPPGEKCLVQE